MRKSIIAILVFVSLIVLIIRFGKDPLDSLLGLKPRAGIRIESTKQAQVLIDNQVVGNTPYQAENLTEKEYLVEIKSEDASSSASWKGYVKLNSGTLSIVKRELEVKQQASSGEVITLEKGQGVTITSTPTDAEIVIDGKSYGRTPISIADLQPGEHQFVLSKQNYLNRAIRAVLVEGFNLNLNVDLALAEADLTNLPTIPISQTSEVVVKPTPTNFLRVRSAATTSSSEVTRVAPGDTLTVLEEQGSWFKVRTSEGKEGYVSATYVEKKQ